MTAPERTSRRGPAETPRVRASRTGRGLVLLTLLGALVVGTSGVASASFTDSASRRSTLATATVAAPTGLTTSVKCTGMSVSVTLGWVPSTSQEVIGYQVGLYLDGGSLQPQANVGPGVTTWTGSAAKSYVTDYVLTLSVTTFTSFGWTKESVRTPRIVC